MISEFPVFTGKIEHAHTVCTRPSLSQREGSGDEAYKNITSCISKAVDVFSTLRTVAGTLSVFF